MDGNNILQIKAIRVAVSTFETLPTMDEENMPEMKMETVFVKSMSIPWKRSGRCCRAGFAHIGAFHKRNSPFPSVFRVCARRQKARQSVAACAHGTAGHIRPWNPT